MSWGWGWRPYVPVAQRRAQAAREMARLRKKGQNIQPVVIAGREIAATFWGRAWCEHLEQFSDFENRLPRGRTYVRNGSVCHLAVRKGKISAKVSGSDLYDVGVSIKTLSARKWNGLRRRCAGQVGSILELLQGRLSDHVMTVVTDRRTGLFPLPGEMTFKCSCPDWASMCKHVAAVLYGVGARLDARPELLFLLRGVDHGELVSEGAATAAVTKAPTRAGRTLDEGSVARVFSIDLTEASAASLAPRPKPAPRRKTATGKRKRAKTSRRRPPARGRRRRPKP